MSKLEHLKKRLKKLAPEIKEKYGARIIGVFGSHATGDEERTSDIDLLASFGDSATLFDYIDLCDFLEEKLDKSVDVVTERGVRKEMKESIYNQLVRL